MISPSQDETLALSGMKLGAPILSPIAPTNLDIGLLADRRLSLEPAGFELPSYGPGTFVDNVALIPWETAAIVGGTVAIGVADWSWGSSSFHFESEGFFGDDTKNGGMDKLGHAFGSALMADFFTQRLSRKTSDIHAAALTGSLLSYGVMGMVEVFDGFSDDHGFSGEDVVMNTIGVTFSYLRNTVPGLKEKLDFRLEYIPSGYGGTFKPHSDYAGQKYVLALKLAGFEQFEDTPLRYVELQAGYFTEGFERSEAMDKNISESQHPYLAIGVNLSELLFKEPDEAEPLPVDLARYGFQWFQIPYTYATFDPKAYDY